MLMQEQIIQKKIYTLDDIQEVSKMTGLSSDEITKLINLGEEARNKSYSPYSKFRVGSSLITESGKYFQGANIENISYGLTVCAERTCIFSAVLAGENKIKAITASTDLEDIVSPCGACRQVIAEFGTPLIFTVSKNKTFKVYTLNEILPDGCRIDHLRN
jgi:cytidine deaminase